MRMFRLGIGLAAGALLGLLAAALARCGDVPPCGALIDSQAACVVSVSSREQRLAWDVTKEGRYQLEARQMPGEKKRLNPAIQVEDRWGQPMNVGMNLELGTAASDFKTKTKNLKPGTYTVYVWSMADEREQVQLVIEPLAEPPA